MGFGTHSLDTLRKIGRGYVLPTQEIKNLLDSYVRWEDLECVLDFGAGTLFWSEFFAKRLSQVRGGVIAIDSLYKTYKPTPTYPNITCLADLSSLRFGDATQSAQGAQSLDSYSHANILFFASDVLHHLDSQSWQGILHTIAPHARYIVIKDIDATHRFGNFANAMHDLLINGERVRSIYPKALSAELEALGFGVQYFYLPKLWYPHFLLIATRSGT